MSLISRVFLSLRSPNILIPEDVTPLKINGYHMCLQNLTMSPPPRGGLVAFRGIKYHQHNSPLNLGFHAWEHSSCVM